MRRNLLAENINAKYSEQVSNRAILIRGTYSATFFFKNRFKNQHLFLKSDGFWNRKDRAIAWHAFPASPVQNSGVTHFVRKTEKNSKIGWFSRYFKNLLHEGLSIGCQREKNYRNFWMVNFGVKKIFPENWVFFNFCKKIE